MTTRKQISKPAYAAMAALEAYARSAVSSHDSHLIRLRASRLNGCRYCTVMHRTASRKDGWDDERIQAAEGGTSPDRRDRAVLQLTDAVTHLDGEASVPDQMWSEVVECVGESGAVQLLMEIVTINAWNRIAATTRLDPTTLKGASSEDLKWASAN